MDESNVLVVKTKKLQNYEAVTEIDYELCEDARCSNQKANRITKPKTILTNRLENFKSQLDPEKYTCAEENGGHPFASLHDCLPSVGSGKTRMETTVVGTEKVVFYELVLDSIWPRINNRINMKRMKLLLAH